MDYKPILLCFVFMFCIHQSLTKSGNKYKDGDIRLVGGGRRWRGTVLILRKNKWGAICDQDWGLNDATVVCRQIGYNGALEAPTASKFGPGRKRKWMTGFRCRGTEKRLTSCIWDRRRHGDKCSGFRRSAGVVCTQSPVFLQSVWSRRRNNYRRTTRKPTTTTTTTTTTTPPTTTTTTTTTTTPTTTTTTTTIPTTTRHIMSDLEEEIAAWAEKHENETESDEEDSTSETERPKSDAPMSPETNAEYILSPPEYLNASSDPEEDVELKYLKKYAGLKKAKINDGKIPVLADDPPDDMEVEIRIKGGRYVFEGRLEVRLNGGKWGVACSDHWTLREVMVACRQIGTVGKAKQPLKYAYFGGTKMDKIIHRIDCIGREKSLDECTITRTEEGHECSKITSVAGMVCSDNLPDLVPSIDALQYSARLQDQPLFYLRCSMEENCLSSSAYVIRNTSLAWRNNIRRLFRFSTVVHNKGISDFRPFRAKDQWEWHACHMHYHSMEIFAHYDIMDADGNRLAEGSKASFCLEDTVCFNGSKPKYNCAGFAEQGLSVNCSDNYMYDIDCQWIDITDIKPGDYTFLMEVNPDLYVAEINFDNNVISCNLHYNGYFASLRNCHHQSLLDYRRPLKTPP